MNINHGDEEVGKRIRVSKTASCRGFGQICADKSNLGSQITGSLDHRVTRLPALLGFLFLFVVIPAAGQTTEVKIRLYSLHSEQRIAVTAETDELAWRTCELCEAKRASGLILEAAAQGMKIQGERQKQVFIEGDYRIEPGEGRSLRARFPLEIRGEQGGLRVFLRLPLEEYVVVALAGESGNFQHEESLKAMAVAVRTYAAHFRGRHAGQGFDFCDSTHCQTLNFKGISPRTRGAVESTRGEILWYQGSPAATFYHQHCGGTMAAAQEAWPDLRAPYLKQQTDPYCVRGVPLPWKAHLDRKQLENALRLEGLTVPARWDMLAIVKRSPSGRVLKLAFSSGDAQPTGAGDGAFISASSLRFAIGRTFGWNQVRSDLYDVETTADSVIFSGRGAGHGVGLCQAGAEEMAKEGQTYRQILAFYYPGTSLVKTATGLAWQKRNGNRFELLSVQPEQDTEVLHSAETILPTLEAQVGWRLEFKPQLKVYPTLDVYRDATGQPGWIAAFTSGHTIRLQPLAALKKKSVLESTLRHEFAHLLIEARAHAGTPLWFREGLVLHFADTNHHFEPIEMNEAEIEKALAHPVNRQDLERAYAAARTKVARMVEQNGRETILRWLAAGLPEPEPHH
jgi:stage II sporulation protein D